jgi:hypothetical protein
MPRIGERVRVWPTADLRVLEFAPGYGPERFLPAEGREVTWSAHLERRQASGELTLHDPRPAAFAPLPGLPIAPQGA